MYKEYDIGKTEYDQKKDELKIVERRIETHREKIAPLTSMMEVWRKKKSLIDTELTKKFRKKVSDLQDIEDSLSSRLERADDKLQNAEQEYNKIKSNYETLQAQLRAELEAREQCMQRLRVYKSEREFKNELEQINDQSKQNDHQIRSLYDTSEELNEQIRKIQVSITQKQRTIEKLSQADNKIYNYLKRQNIDKVNHALHARDWIHLNSDKFQYPVIGPVALEIKCTDKTALTILENHLPFGSLWTFIVQCPEDQNTLYREVRLNKKLAIDIYNCNPETSVFCNARQPNFSDAIKRPYQMQTLAKLKNSFGIRGFIDELVDLSQMSAPLVDFLSTYGIFNSLVGNQVTEECLTMVQNELLGSTSNQGHRGPSQAMIWVIDERTSRLKRINILRSRYDQNISSNMQSGKPLNLLAVCLEDTSQTERQIERLQSEIENETKTIESHSRESQTIENKLTQANATKAKLSATRANLGKARKERDSVKKTIKRLDEKILGLQDELSSDMEDKKIEVCRKRMNLLKQFMEIINESRNIIGKSYELKLAETLNVRVLSSIFNTRVTEIKRAIDTSEDDIQADKRQFANLRASVTELRTTLKAKKEQVTRDYPYSNNNEGMNEFGEFLTANKPREYEDLREEMDQLEAEIVELVDDENVIQLYEQKTATYNELSLKLEKLETSSARNQTKLHKTAKRWKEKLGIICNNKLNIRFKKYMQAMNCDGEVSLDAQERYENYGIKIKVRFREEAALTVLSATSNSGGERSVSTILFLLALQSIHKSCFRAVDEINQGMDERNERLVVSRIVANCWGRDKPQFFLITPKLLPCLNQFSCPNVTTLVVFNAEGLFRQKEFDFYGRVLEGLKRKRESNSFAKAITKGTDDEPRQKKSRGNKKASSEKNEESEEEDEA